jgi:NADPH-dependent curcumin reductase CurA
MSAFLTSSAPTVDSHCLDTDRECIKPMKVGSIVPCFAVGRVIEAFGVQEYSPGDHIFGHFSWSEYFILDTNLQAIYPPQKLDPSVDDPAHFLAVGLPGVVAYEFMQVWFPPNHKDIWIVISGAAGATGSIAVQLAKSVKGAKHVWGIAAGKTECAMVIALGADTVFDYTVSGWEKEFLAAAKKMDNDKIRGMYFDTMRGKLSHVVFCGLRPYSYMVSCLGVVVEQVSWFIGMSSECVQVLYWKNIKGSTFIVFDQGWEQKDMLESLGKLMELVRGRNFTVLKTVRDASFEELPRGLETVLKGRCEGRLVTKMRE